VQALSQVVPRQVCGSCGNGGGLLLAGQQGGNFWLQVELFSGSYGGRWQMDGMDSVDVLYANTRNNPIEDIESHVPLRIERYELRENVAAAGRWRGGVGSIRHLRFLSPGSASVESEGHKYPPKGLFGGADGTPSQLVRIKADGSEIQLPSKVPHHPFGEGESIVAIRRVRVGTATRASAIRRLCWMMCWTATSLLIRPSSSTESGSQTARSTFPQPAQRALQHRRQTCHATSTSRARSSAVLRATSRAAKSSSG
jgi:hypothetical protein